MSKLRFSISTLLVVITIGQIAAQAPSTAKVPNEIDSNGKLQGPWLFNDENGNPFLIAHYKDSKPQDTLYYIKENKVQLKLLELGEGRLLMKFPDSPKEIYRTKENGKYVFRWDDGSICEEGSSLLLLFDIQAQFKGGPNAFLQYQAENLNYPPSAVKRKVEGDVTARFILNKNGTVRNVEIVRGLNRKCDQEVIRMLQAMPAWQPGLQRGHPVASRMTVVIKFRL